jgi:hypothetical protein
VIAEILGAVLLLIAWRRCRARMLETRKMPSHCSIFGRFFCERDGHCKRFGFTVAPEGADEFALQLPYGSELAQTALKPEGEHEDAYLK